MHHCSFSLCAINLSVFYLHLQLNKHVSSSTAQVASNKDGGKVPLAGVAQPGHSGLRSSAFAPMFRQFQDNQGMQHRKIYLLQVVWLSFLGSQIYGKIEAVKRAQ